MSEDKPEKKRRLTRKQARLARERVKDPEATLSELGERTGYASKTKVHRALQLEHVQDRVRELMDRSPKLGVKALLKKLEEGLDAEETKFFAHEGKVITKKNCIDFPTRHRYLDTALELRGLQEKRVRVSSDPDPTMTKEQALEILARAQSLGVAPSPTPPPAPALLPEPPTAES